MKDRNEFLKQLNDKVVEVVILLRDEVHHEQYGMPAWMMADWYKKVVDLELTIKQVKELAERSDPLVRLNLKPGK